MNKSLFRSQIHFFDLDHNHNPILTLALLCTKRENLTINYFLILLSYRYTLISVTAEQQ
jgi:hypothetical protein